MLVAADALMTAPHMLTGTSLEMAIPVAAPVTPHATDSAGIGATASRRRAESLAAKSFAQSR